MLRLPRKLPTLHNIFTGEKLLVNESATALADVFATSPIALFAP